MAAPNRYYEFAIYKENGIGIAFSNDDGGLALKAGAYWHKSEESLEKVKYEHVDWEVQGVRLNAVGGISDYQPALPPGRNHHCGFPRYYHSLLSC